MATWTGAELRNATLRYLGILGSGQQPAAEDADLVDKAWTSLYKQLRRKGLAPWPSSDEIPEEAQQPLKKYLGSEVAPEFGIEGKEMAGMGGYKELEQQAAGSRSPVSLRPKYF